MGKSLTGRLIDEYMKQKIMEIRYLETSTRYTQKHKKK